MPAPSSLNALRITNKIKADFLADFLQLFRTNFAVQSRYVFMLKNSHLSTIFKYMHLISWHLLFHVTDTFVGYYTSPINSLSTTYCINTSCL